MATKRSSAEKIVNSKDLDSIVIEPYANPFRTYQLADDYNKFKSIFSNNKVDCYIFNTGFFMNKKVTKDVTISSLEKIVENTAEFSKWDRLSISQ